MGRGSVTLVGAGPGDPGLMTVKGALRLSRAEVVVYDRLVPPEILAMIPRDAERICVGKNSDHHPVPQDEINRILREKVDEGRLVVRLKGGDPFVFGRGGEELECLMGEGLDCEVVPGVSSAVAAPAYAGIPLTHRDYCSSFHVVTAHARGNGTLELPYRALAALDGTLVFLMCVATAETVCRGLLEAGMDGDLPAAMVENGTLPQQRTLLSTLSRIAAEAKEREIRAPSVLVIGKVCALAESLDWRRGSPAAEGRAGEAGPSKGILILAHGSREDATERTMERVRDLVRAKLPGAVIEIAYLQFRKADLAAGLGGLVAAGVRRIAVVPYFLFEGIHIKQDIPAEIRSFQEGHPGVEISLAGSLGADERLSDILVDRIKGAFPG